MYNNTAKNIQFKAVPAPFGSRSLSKEVHYQEDHISGEV